MRMRGSVTPGDMVRGKGLVALQNHSLYDSIKTVQNRFTLQVVAFDNKIQPEAPGLANEAIPPQKMRYHLFFQRKSESWIFQKQRQMQP